MPGELSRGSGKIPAGAVPNKQAPKDSARDSGSACGPDVISYHEALELILAECSLLDEEIRPLAKARGSVAARPIAALLDVPAFANAAMDGYALAARDTAGATASQPVWLPVTALVPAGTRPEPLRPGGAVEIMTGAPLPAGADAVVPRERVRHVPGADGSPGYVEIGELPAAGRNVRHAGEDFVHGQVVVDAGTQLAPHHLMALAACGLDHITVRRAPRAAILTTGTEILAAGSKLPAAGIRDANGPYLAALLESLGVMPESSGSSGDDLDGIRQAIARLDGRCDLILTTGGVSAGRLDLVPDAIRAAGGRMVFHKVAIRPGKPLLYARLPAGSHLFALPGNPLAVAVGMRFFVIPALRAMLGLLPEELTPAIAADVVRGRGDLRFFAKAHRRVTAGGHCQVSLLPGQESFRIGPLLRANCWAVVPEGGADLPAGSTLLTADLYP